MIFFFGKGPKKKYGRKYTPIRFCCSTLSQSVYKRVKKRKSVFSDSFHWRKTRGNLIRNGWHYAIKMSKNTHTHTHNFIRIWRQILFWLKVFRFFFYSVSSEYFDSVGRDDAASLDKCSDVSEERQGFPSHPETFLRNVGHKSPQ